MWGLFQFPEVGYPLLLPRCVPLFLPLSQFGPCPPLSPLLALLGCQTLRFPWGWRVGLACLPLPPGPAEQALQARRQPIMEEGVGAKPSAGDLGRWPCSEESYPRTCSLPTWTPTLFPLEDKQLRDVSQPSHHELGLEPEPRLPDPNCSGPALRVRPPPTSQMVN